MINRQSGVIVVRAMPNELRDVADYLAKTETTVTRQVVLEAKMIEVELSDAYQAGINWAAVLTRGQPTSTSSVRRRRAAASTATCSRPRNVPVTVAPGQSRSTASSPMRSAAPSRSPPTLTDFNAFIELLGLQGRTRVLSSPRVSTLHNQKAIIKAGTDEFFVTGVSERHDHRRLRPPPRSTYELTPFFSGVALDVTPQISEDGDGADAHPPDRQRREDQQKDALGARPDRFDLPLALSQIRESDSIVRARSGQVIVIGGLMRETRKREDYKTAVPRRRARSSAGSSAASATRPAPRSW